EGQRVTPIGGDVDHVACVRHHRGHELANGRIIVDHEDVCHSSWSVSGALPLVNATPRSSAAVAACMAVPRMSRPPRAWCPGGAARLTTKRQNEKGMQNKCATSHETLEGCNVTVEPRAEHRLDRRKQGKSRTAQ